jgi:simple sugar transport system ATP-binding protein
MSDMTALMPLAADETPAPLLTVSGLEVRFGAVRALHGVDLSVRPGELIALAGENGAGKTTLVRCIAGDIAPTRGEIFLAGRKVPADPAAAAPAWRLRRAASPR